MSQDIDCSFSASLEIFELILVAALTHRPTSFTNQSTLGINVALSEASSKPLLSNTIRPRCLHGILLHLDLVTSRLVPPASNGRVRGDALNFLKSANFISNQFRQYCSVGFSRPSLISTDIVIENVQEDVPRDSPSTEKYTHSTPPGRPAPIRLLVSLILPERFKGLEVSLGPGLIQLPQRRLSGLLQIPIRLQRKAQPQLRFRLPLQLHSLSQDPRRLLLQHLCLSSNHRAHLETGRPQ